MENSIVSENKSLLKESTPNKDEKSKKKKSLAFALPDEPPAKPEKRVSIGSTPMPQKQQGRARFAPQTSSAKQDSKPEWYQEMGDSQVAMFREVFEMLDHDGGGSIDAEELYSVMKDLDIAISLEEIQTVLKELDTDGNGEIDFDEFLYAMTETDRMLDSLAEDPEKANQESAKGEYTRRQTLFFTAITKFAMKNSLGEIERYYATRARKVPHVISHYTAGARLDGLNDKQLESAMRRMQIDAKKYDSPYAKPLPFVVLPLKKGKGKGKKAKKQEAEVPVVNTPTPEQALTPSEISEDYDSPGLLEPQISKPSVASLRSPARRCGLRVDSTEMHFMKVLQEMASKGSVIARLPGVHRLPQVRAQLETGKVSNMLGRKGAKNQPNIEEDADEGRPEDMPNNTVRYSAGLNRSLPQKHGWTCPRVDTCRAPMPVITFEKGRANNLTIEDVPLIRKKVSSTLDQYYSTLRKAHVKTAWEHWDRLHTEEIPSKQLLQNFRKVYRAYSPHKEDEVFVICPWIPGPQHFHHQFRNRSAPQEGAWNPAPAAGTRVTPEIGRRSVTPTRQLRPSTLAPLSPYLRPRSTPV